MTVLVRPRPQPDLGCCAHFPSHAQHVHCRGAGWHEMRSMHSARHPAPRHPTLEAPRLGSGAVGPGAVEPVALGAVGPGAVGPAFATQPWTYRPQRAAAGYSRCETGSPRAPHARRPPHLTVRSRSPDPRQFLRCERPYVWHMAGSICPILLHYLRCRSQPPTRGGGREAGYGVCS